MELPINVIVILFVAVAVGTALIFLSQDIFFNSKSKIYDLDLKGVENNKIIETVSNVTAGTIRALAEECVKISEGVPHRELCFVVRGQKEDVENADGDTTNLRNFIINTTATIGGNVTMIYYDPSGTVWVEY